VKLIISDTSLYSLSEDTRVPKEYLAQLKNYGQCEIYITPYDTIIITLPTRTLPVSHLIEENWVAPTPYGNVRNVFLVEQLIDGTQTNLFIKSPERLFTSNQILLGKKDFWWGGRRSGEKPLLIQNNPAIEEQGFWEAIFLLELAKNKIKAEIPQAILITNPIEYRVIVERIERGLVIKGPGLQEITSSIQKLGIIPVDLSYYNIVPDRDGYIHIIDTNRWYWPPYTDAFIQKIFETIRAATLPEKIQNYNINL